MEGLYSISLPNRYKKEVREYDKTKDIVENIAIHKKGETLTNYDCIIGVVKDEVRDPTKNKDIGDIKESVETYDEEHIINEMTVELINGYIENIKDSVETYDEHHVINEMSAEHNDTENVINETTAKLDNKEVEEINKNFALFRTKKEIEPRNEEYYRPISIGEIAKDNEKILWNGTRTKNPAGKGFIKASRHRHKTVESYRGNTFPPKCAGIHSGETMHNEHYTSEELHRK